MKLSMLFVSTLLLLIAPARATGPALRLESSPDGAIAFLSWDTEGGARIATNLLRSPVQNVSASADAAGGFAVTMNDDNVRFPFDPRVTPTTVIPAQWHDDGGFDLPAVVNAPDFGLMLLTQSGGAALRGRFEGSRAEKRSEIVLRGGRGTGLTFKPLHLPPPVGLKDAARWPMARRGWLNAIQPCSQWGDQDRPFSAPAGILGNNVISDPASASIWFYADQSFWIPEPAPGVSLMPMLRRSIEYWIDRKMRRDAAGNETGEITCYWDYGNFLDANAGPIIAAWDYVEVTADRAWLEKKLVRLEMAADFLLRRDIDDDGLIEATQSGNANTLHEPNRSCAWWDAINCGHKDAYTNAIIYRALRCLADLEKQLGRDDKTTLYAGRADKLKAAYFKTLYNEKTGLIAWWKSADGVMHDYASPTTCGLAIDYGLVPDEQARAMVARLWAKIDQVGFDRFDLGVPPMLVPVLRADYLQPHGFGIPSREDGTDTIGMYMNGGITAGQVLHFLNANFVTGNTGLGDRLLDAMLERQQRGEFQNGVTDEPTKGIDWTTWDGRPSGYEGYLADSFRVLQAVLLREPAMRARLYRPMMPAD